MAFRKREGFGGGNRPGGFRQGGSRPPFNKGGGFGGSRGFGGDRPPKQMHEATCADCGNQTEVPFRPDGSRPIYCQNCFPKHDMGRPVPPPRRDMNRGGFERRESVRPMVSAPDTRIDILMRDVASLAAKVDALHALLAAAPAPAPMPVAAKKTEKSAVPAKKEAAEKPVAKKAAKKSPAKKK